MNKLVVGTNKEPLFEDLPPRFLMIDDGALFDELTLPTRKEISLGAPVVEKFNVKRDHLNPLKGMSYKRARDFISVLDAVFPEGSNTLTRKNSNFVLLKALLDGAPFLDKLIPLPDPKDTGAVDAYQKIETLLLSPVLRAVLNRPTNVSLKGIVLAKLDRAELGDFDCFVLGNVLMSLYSGTVIVPDFGFYGREHHIGLIRQGRLMAGVNTLSEVSVTLRHALLGIEDRQGSGAIYDDAKTLALYAGLTPATVEFNGEIENSMK